MPKEYEMPMGDDEAAEASPEISEEYIEKVKNGINKTIPEDFSPSSVSIPVEAADGEEVAMIVTGIASGGKLKDASVAVLDLAEAEPEQKPKRLNKMFGGENEQEEMQ